MAEEVVRGGGQREAVGMLETERVVAGRVRGRFQMLRGGWGVQHNCTLCLSLLFPESPRNTV